MLGAKISTFYANIQHSWTNLVRMKIGLLREGKIPIDRRVPLTPKQAVELQERFSVVVVAQSSDIRAFSDSEYAKAGIEVVDSVEDCDVLLGVKEVPIPQLIPGKTYFFFSHTYKKQPYNAKLLKACVDHNIRLIDYELLTKRWCSRRCLWSLCRSSRCIQWLARLG